MEPTGGDGDGGYEFVNAVTGGRIPREYIPAVDEGIQEAMEFGVLAGYPMVDVKVTLQDGAYHDVDSSELAFKIAGSMAFKEAARRAKPTLLEPIMKIEVTTPDDYLGEVIGDINSRRGHVQKMDEASRQPGHHGPCAAVGDLRVRWRPAEQDPGSRRATHGVPLLRRGSEDRGGRDRQKGAG